MDQFLRVKGQSDVWAVGYVSAVQRAQYINADKQSAHAVKNIKLGLNGAEMVPFEAGGKGLLSCSSPSWTLQLLLSIISVATNSWNYLEMLAVTIGKKAGTGHMGNMKFPSFMINMMKGKTLFTEKMPLVINGSAF